MPGPLAEYVERVKGLAEDQAYQAELAKVTSRRQAERFLIKRGAAGPFDDLVLEDLATLEKTGTLAHLRQNPAFAAREKLLLEEREAAVHAAKEAGEEAALRAAQSPPKLVAFDEEAEKARLGFLMQTGSVEPDTMPGAVRASWDALLERQGRERAALEKKEAARERAAKR